MFHTRNSLFVRLKSIQEQNTMLKCIFGVNKLLNLQELNIWYLNRHHSNRLAKIFNLLSMCIYSNEYNSVQRRMIPCSLEAIHLFNFVMKPLRTIPIPFFNLTLAIGKQRILFWGVFQIWFIQIGFCWAKSFLGSCWYVYEFDIGSIAWTQHFVDRQNEIHL